MTENKIVIKTKHGEVTLDQLAENQPGMARLMKEIGERYNITYFAAKGGNWKLAEHELKQIISLMKTAIVFRPKYTQDLANFITSEIGAIMNSIHKRNWDSFQDSFEKGIESSNRLHEKYGYGYIRYTIAKHPPENYDLEYNK